MICIVIEEVLWRLNAQTARLCFDVPQFREKHRVITISEEIVMTPAKPVTKLTIKKYFSLRSAQQFVWQRRAVVKEKYEGELSINPIVEGVWLIEMTVPSHYTDLDLTEVI